MKQLLIFFLAISSITFVQAQSQNNNMNSGTSNDSFQVKINAGIVEGIKESSGIISFKGIPFAAPPVGERRWKAPQPIESWQGVKATKQFGPRGMQPPLFSDMVFRSNGMSEDCLYLNVWTPALRPGEKLPVLVYFYGGGFVTGDGSEGRYDGESMAKQGIVSLTVNYRMGVFGFLAHPQLSKESAQQSSGNYALLDQAAALKWVQENIAVFGGDPKKVTIAGESAGSVSVSAQMTSPLSRDLISGAIGESGSLLGTLRAVSKEEAEKTGEEFAARLGAKSIAELRKIPADSILSASVKFGPFRFAMNIDGYFFPKSPYQVFEAGEQANVPLLAGWNSEESGASAIMNNQAMTIENYRVAVKKLYGDNADEVLKAYAPQTDKDVEQVATDLAGDRFIGYSTWKWTDLHAKTSGKPVYRYYYERARPPLTSSTSNQNAPRGAAHSAEIEYAMGNLHYNKVYNWSDEDRKVSKTMQQYFVNFIKTGNPNGGGVPEWTPVKPGEPANVMRIDVNTRPEIEKHRERYLLIDKITSSQTKAR
jgi:para-nitrobenzyl esterase